MSYGLYSPPSPHRVTSKTICTEPNRTASLYLISVKKYFALSTSTALLFYMIWFRFDEGKSEFQDGRWHGGLRPREMYYCTFIILKLCSLWNITNTRKSG